MDKLKMESTSLNKENIQRIRELFPSCITEVIDESGKLKRVINFDKLKEFLCEDAVAVYSEGRECYEFTWPGKKAAILKANTPIRKTLRPCVEDSVNWNTTENLYLEGDNLEVLKLLQESYLNKVKVIYIDPPYNTGNDFIYNDVFKMTQNQYADELGATSEEGIRLVKNTDTNGRFHSDWCSMIYSRLLLARNLLAEDGVIFISIDSNEVHNLRKMADEIFGENNFISDIIWERAYAPINLKKHFSASHDYILVYSKNIEQAVNHGIERGEESDGRYKNPDNDPRGVWQSDNMSVGPAIAENIYPIETPSGRIVEPPAGRSWRLSKKAFFERLQDNRIWFGSDGNGVPRIKRFLNELRKTGITPMTIWKHEDVDHSQGATKKLAALFDGKKFFDYPKSVELVKRCISLYSDSDSIVMDFFAGSSTTAHAVMQLNAEDGGSRKVVLVQLPEAINEDSEAYKAGYKTICDIGKDRIRRAASKIQEEIPEAKFDGGFRVLKLDDGNMTDVYYSPSEYKQDLLSSLVSNIKPERSGLDLLFGCLIDWGLPLSLPYSVDCVEECTIHDYNQGDLVACFDEHIPESVIKHIAGRHPLRVVFRDSSFKDSPSKINVKEIFKLLSPDTRVKVM